MKHSLPTFALAGALLLAGVLPALHAADAPPASNVSLEIAAILNTSNTVQAINAAPFAARGTITKDVQSRLEAATEILQRLELRANDSSAPVRTAFAKARADVLTRESALRDSLQKAAGTEAEPAWEPARDVLARDFEAYGLAATNAEIALQTPPDGNP